MKVFVHARPDGGVSVVRPVFNARLGAEFGDETFNPPMPAWTFWRKGPEPDSIVWAETEDEFLARLQTTIIPADATDVVIVDETAIPTDREFRNAWERDTSPGPNPIAVNMPKAAVIHMDKIRVKRDEALVAEDNKLRAAQDDNDGPAQAAIRTERKRLRNLPATFDLSGATTPTELSALWPAGLTR